MSTEEIRILPGTTIFREVDGLAGTDEIQIYHDGTNGYVSSEFGNLIINGSVLIDQSGNLSAKDVIVDGTAVLTTNQTITLSGDVAGSGGTAITTTLATVNSDVGTYGDNTHTAIVTVNAKGLITAISTGATALGTGSVTNIATGTGLTGGAITNTGTISMATSGVTAGTYGNSTQIPQIVVDALGRVTSATTESTVLGTGSVTNIATGTGLTGGPITNTGTISMATSGVTAGTYGAPLAIPQIVFDALGRATFATNETTLGSMALQNPNSVNITGGTITGMSNPTAASDVATKNYVDSLQASLNIHQPVAAATLTNLTATYGTGSTGADGGNGVGATLTNSGSQVAFSTDSYNAALNDRILVRAQTTQLQNGIYTVTVVGTTGTNWVLTRASDYDNHAIATDVDQGDFVIVENGSTYANTAFVETGTNPIIVGTSNIIFTQFSGAQQPNTFTGDVTGFGAGTVALTISTNAVTTTKINANAVTYAKIQNASPTTILGNSGTAVGNVGEIAIGTGLTLGTNGTLAVTSHGITYGLMQQTTGSAVLLGGTAASSTIQEIILGSNLSMTSGTLNVSSGAGLTGTTTGASTFNTALGVGAGTNTTTAIDNTLIGYQAGRGITTGSFNTALGYQALAENTLAMTGVGNVGLGYQAGNAIQTGSYNVAIGYAAGDGLSSTTGAIIIGASAGGLINGTNTIIGFKAGSNLGAATAGNTIIGYQAAQGSANATIINNVIIGDNAVSGANFVSNNNVIIGQGAGTTLTTGSNNILIGQGILGAGATVSNQTIIGTFNLGTLGTGSVTSVSTGTGLTGGAITGAGTISVAANGITLALIQQSVGSGVLLGGTAASTNYSEITIGTGLTLSAGTLTAAGGSGTSTTHQVTQAASAFAVGNVLNLSAGTYALAMADTAFDAEVVGIVSAAAGSTFTVLTDGYITGLSGLTAGSVFFLSPSVAGALTSTAPSTAGQISKPLLIADSTTSGYFFNFRGQVISSLQTEAGSTLLGNPTGVAAAPTAIPLSSNLRFNSGTLDLGTTIITPGAVINTPANLTSGTVVTINLGTSNNFVLTLGTNVNLANPSNMVAGQSGNIILNQNASTAYSISFGTFWKSSNGQTPNISQTLGAQNLISYFVADSSHIWYSLQNNGVA